MWLNIKIWVSFNYPPSFYLFQYSWMFLSSCRPFWPGVCLYYPSRWMVFSSICRRTACYFDGFLYGQTCYITLEIWVDSAYTTKFDSSVWFLYYICELFDSLLYQLSHRFKTDSCSSRCRGISDRNRSSEMRRFAHLS